MKVLTHNVMLLSWLMRQSEGDWNNAERARLIAESEYVLGHDVLVLQELFDPDPSEDLLDRLATKGYRHRTAVTGVSESGWDATSGRAISDFHVRGGVTVLSRWPITWREQYVFEDACGWDAEADKGFAYAVVQAVGGPVHVIGTQLQSDGGGCVPGQAKVKRRTQMHEIDAFLTAKRIPSTQPVLVAGDFNTDRHSPDFQDILSFGRLVDPGKRTGWPCSYDTAHNGIAARRRPGGPKRDSDNVLLRESHARPHEDWSSEVRNVRSPTWEAGGAAFTDYSDHYPVAAGRLT